MKMNEILDNIRSLACSQGFYGRLYRSLMDIRMTAPEVWRSVVLELEKQHFTDVVDMVLYFES